MTLAQYDISEYLEAAQELAAIVATATDRIDEGREIPPDIASEIADKGFFRLLVPRSLGGTEMDYLDYLRIVRVFAEADGSVGWCINQNNVFATNSATIPEKTAQEIWGDRRAVVSNGPPASSSIAIPVDGGYRITGRWNFSSGFRHATWVAALTPIGDSKDGNQPTGNARTMLVPKNEISPVDIWQVNGLRGTGSFSFEAQDLFVPDSRTYAPSDRPREDGALYVMPTNLLFASGFATVALGVARASLDAAIDLAGRKVPGLDRELLRDKSTTQRDVGKAEAAWNAARAFLLESISSAWQGARNNHSLTIEERIRLRLAGTHAIRTAADVVDVAYRICGSNAIFTANPIQRRFQDVHVITQQAQGRMMHYDTAGQYFLGIEPEGHF